MTDNLIRRIEAYLAEHPHTSRAQMIKALGTSQQTLKKLEKLGVPLPLKQSASIGGMKARKLAMKAGRVFAIKKTA